jgi:hypothetical protein
MAKPKQADKLNIDALIALKDGAVSFIKVAEEALEIMKSDDLACYNLKSGLSGIDRLKSFKDALSQAILLHRTGRALGAGQFKKRTTAKKKTKGAATVEKKTSSTLRVAEKSRQKYKNEDSQ